MTSLGASRFFARTNSILHGNISRARSSVLPFHRSNVSLSTAMPPRKRKTGASATAEAPKSKRTKSTRASQNQPNTASKSKMSQQAKAENPFTSYPPSKVNRLIEPGPILLVSTGPTSKPDSGSDPNPNDINLMTMGFHMMLRHSPALIGACIGPWDATHARLKATGECVLAIPSAEMAQTVVDIGNCSINDIAEANKFEKFGLDALPAAQVKAPLVGGEHIIANVECVVDDDKLVGKYNLWVLKVVKVWVNEAKMPVKGGRMLHHRGDGTFTVDGEAVVDMKERMVKWRQLLD